MKKIHNVIELKREITELEIRKDAEELILKERFTEMYNAYRPINVIKNSFEEAAISPKFRHNLLNVAIGACAGYLAKKLAVGRSAGLLTRVADTVLQYGI